MAIIRGRIGPIVVQDGTYPEIRSARKGSLTTQDIGGRFEEACYRGALFSGSLALTSISNASFALATAVSGTLATAAGATPIIGVWNPPSSGVNLTILQAIISTIITALQVTGPGPYLWVGYTGQTTALSTAAASSARKLGLISGQGKVLAGTALTGLQNTFGFSATCAAGVPMLNASTLQTAAGLMPPNPSSIDNVDGSIIVPPGGILGLFTSGTPVAISAAASLLWEETPL